MSTDNGAQVGEVSPAEAQDLLRNRPNARLVDVRSRAEWDFVGGPDVSGFGQTLIRVEWAAYPGMVRNADFLPQLEAALGGIPADPVLFICRSGVRSLKAAEAYASRMAAEGRAVTCLNVAEGFEGDLDAHKQRGSQNGWKSRGLPWTQS